MAVGGLVGFGEDTAVSGTFVTGTVTCKADSVGGLIGSSYLGSITDSGAAVTVVSEMEDSWFTGGLVGQNTRSVINRTYATGDVESSGYYVGGLVGANRLGHISDSYATGDVKGEDAVGGLVGDNYGSIGKTYATGAVILTEPGGAVGGLVGLNTGNVEGSYYNSETSGQSDNDGRGEPRSIDQMTFPHDVETTYINWDFENTWGIDQEVNNGYPFLKGLFSLSNLTVTEGSLAPAFDPDIVNYEVQVGYETTSMGITATLAFSNASITINGDARGSGETWTMDLDVGDNVVNIVVTAADGVTTRTYTVTVTRAADDSGKPGKPGKPDHPGKPDSPPGKPDHPGRPAKPK